MSNPISPYYFEFKLSDLINSIEFPLNNRNPELHKVMSDFYMGTIMQSEGKRLRENAIKVFKATPEFAPVITKETDGQVDLIGLNPFYLSVKVDKGLQRFDKNEFIKAISEKHNIPASELLALSINCVTQSAPKVSFSMSVTKDGK